MTVTTTLDRQFFPGDGANKNFPFNFKFFENSQIYVYLIDPNGNSVGQTLNVNYTLSGAMSPSGGTVVMEVAPPVSCRLYVRRRIPQTQLTSIRNQGAFFPAIHEDVFDRLTMLVQQSLANDEFSIQLDQSGLLWDFKGNRGINAADPVNDQDVVTKRWAGLYIDSISGNVNTTTGIGYAGGSLFDYLKTGVYRSVPSIDALCQLSVESNTRAIVSSYYGDGKSDARSFRYESNHPKNRHNGGSIISPTVPRGVLPANLPDFLKGVGESEPSGFGCWIDENSNNDLHIDQFGAIADLPSAALSNYAAIRAAVSCALTHYIAKLDGQRTVHLGIGEYFVTGQSPFMLNRSEMLALPGGYRYRRGFMIQGGGRNASIITLVTGGTQELYFYSTKDTAFPGDTSVADNVTWQDFTCRGLPDRRASLPDSQKISGLYMESYGWEKYLSVRNVDFEGIDRLAVYAGYGNVDHNWWYNCSFRVIRERMVYFNNNQSVANGFVGCHAEGLRDSLFSVGPEGGGDVSWIGGSLIQEPKVDVNDVPLPDQPPRGLVTWDNSSVTEGRSTGLGNNKFTFQGVRVECYEPSQSHVFTYRSGETAYGYLEVVFKDSSFVNPSIYNNTAVLPTAPYVGCYLENTTSVIYERCDIKYPYTFTIGDNNSEIVFEGGTYVPPPIASPTGGLSAVCTVGGVGGSIIARNVKMNQLITEGDYSATRVADFTKGITGRTKAFTAVQGKHPLSSWPQPGQSGNLKIYVPAGSVIKSVTIDKPADTAVTGVANYELKVLDSGGAALAGTGGGAPTRAITSVMSFVHKMPASPNDFIQISSVGDGASAPFNFKSGNIIVEYM